MKGIKRTEAGQGGKKGHSNMTHWDRTEHIKRRTKRLRRRIDKIMTREDA